MALKMLSLKKIFIGLYLFSFLVYLFIGLQPANSAEAYNISSKLTIPSINLTTDVTSLEIKNNQLETPDTIVGSFTNSANKTLLIGHSTTVFQNLYNIKLNDIINYNNKTYIVTNTEIKEKSEIEMHKLLKTAKHDTLILMTCAGELFDNGDATHRLIVTAEAE